MWLRGRHANQRCIPGVTPRRADVALAEAATASWVRTTPLAAPVLALVATTSGVTVVSWRRPILALGAL